MSLVLPPHFRRRRPRSNNGNEPPWALDSPKAHDKWCKLLKVLGLIQEELPRLDQRSKLAALVDAAFLLGREAEQEKQDKG